MIVVVVTKTTSVHGNLTRGHITTVHGSFSRIGQAAENMGTRWHYLVNTMD